MDLSFLNKNDIFVEWNRASLKLKKRFFSGNGGAGCGSAETICLLCNTSLRVAPFKNLQKWNLCVTKIDRALRETPTLLSIEIVAIRCRRNARIDPFDDNNTELLASFNVFSTPFSCLCKKPHTLPLPSISVSLCDTSCHHLGHIAYALMSVPDLRQSRKKRSVAHFSNMETCITAYMLTSCMDI